MPTPNSNPTSPRDSEPQPELQLNAPELLLNYLHSQFQAAYQKERSDDRAGNTATGGSFYQRKILLDPDESEIIKATTRVVMAPPFSITQKTAQHDFAEIYAISLRNDRSHGAADNNSLAADVFLIRTHGGDNFSPFILADDEGCVPVDVSDLDIKTVLGTDKASPTVKEEINDIFAPLKLANELLQKLETYNIVATND